MNNVRRKQIASIAQELAELQSRLETVRDDEQNAVDNTPESLMTDEKQETLDTLDEACDSLEEVVSNLEGVE